MAAHIPDNKPKGLSAHTPSDIPKVSRLDAFTSWVIKEIAQPLGRGVFKFGKGLSHIIGRVKARILPASAAKVTKAAEGVLTDSLEERMTKMLHVLDKSLNDSITSPTSLSLKKPQLDERSKTIIKNLILSITYYQRDPLLDQQNYFLPFPAFSEGGEVMEDDKFPKPSSESISMSLREMFEVIRSEVEKDQDFPVPDVTSVIRSILSLEAQKLQPPSASSEAASLAKPSISQRSSIERPPPGPYLEDPVERHETAESLLLNLKTLQEGFGNQGRYQPHLVKLISAVQAYIGCDENPLDAQHTFVDFLERNPKTKTSGVLDTFNQALYGMQERSLIDMFLNDQDFQSSQREKERAIIINIITQLEQLIPPKKRDVPT